MFPSNLNTQNGSPSPIGPNTVEFSLTNTCRTCLKFAQDASTLYGVFDLLATDEAGSCQSLKDLQPARILEGLNIKSWTMYVDDGLPQKICSDCVFVLTGLETFRETCSRAQNMLIEIYKNQHGSDNDVGSDLCIMDKSDDENHIEMIIETIDSPTDDQSYINEDGEYDTFEDAYSDVETIVHNVPDDIPKEIKLKSNVTPPSNIKFNGNSPENGKTPSASGKHISPICSKTLNSISTRSTHLQSQNDDNSYRCDACRMDLKSMACLTKHIKSVHMSSDHECPHCLQSFTDSVKFENHLKSHESKKQFKCRFCDNSFTQRHHLDSHVRAHPEPKQFLCSVCGKEFNQECVFKQHQRIHNDEREHAGHQTFQCQQCCKEFLHMSGLTVHLRTHTGERPYKCDKAYTQSQKLKYHKRTTHGSPLFPHTVKPSSVSTTSTKTTSDTSPAKSLSTKMVDSVSPGKRVFPYSCKICNKGFKVLSSLSRHQNVHAEERKHVCADCGNTFKRAEHLRIHINGVHLKQKPYACSVCPRTFAQCGDRNIHMRWHTGEKPHRCAHCNKGFRLAKAMRAHERIHTGEKPYKCELCRQVFMTYAALAFHTAKHNVPGGDQSAK